jgi:hypothetical protein
MSRVSQYPVEWDAVPLLPATPGWVSRECNNPKISCSSTGTHDDFAWRRGAIFESMGS